MGEYKRFVTCWSATATGMVSWFQAQMVFKVIISIFLSSVSSVFYQVDIGWKKFFLSEFFINKVWESGGSKAIR